MIEIKIIDAYDFGRVLQSDKVNLVKIHKDGRARSIHNGEYTHMLKRLFEQPVAFDIDMVLEQLEDYGKYEGVLIGTDVKCENYIPVSVAKQIVKGKGVGGALGYLEEKK